MKIQVPPKRLFLKTLLYLIANVATLNAGTAQWQDGGRLQIVCGDYRLLFRGDAGRMVETLYYQDKQILGGSVPNQALVNITSEDEKEGRWRGGSYGGEEVESFELWVDGQLAPEANGQQEVAGREFKVIKQSRMSPVSYKVETEVTEEGVVERSVFRTNRDSSEKANFLYAFIRNWNTGFTDWYAATVNGPQQGNFSGARTSALDCDAKGVAFWNPGAGLVALFNYAEVYTSKRKFRGKANRLWDHPTHRQLLFRVDAPTLPGEEYRFEARLIVLEASEKDWLDKARMELEAANR